MQHFDQGFKERNATKIEFTLLFPDKSKLINESECFYSITYSLKYLLMSQMTKRNKNITQRKFNIIFHKNAFKKCSYYYSNAYIL